MYHLFINEHIAWVKIGVQANILGMIGTTVAVTDTVA
jgi:hypothetical protein